MGFQTTFTIADEHDIWRAAHVLVEQYGEDAPTVAALRFEVMAARDDLNGQLAWKRTGKAVAELLRTRRDADKREH
jgi:hypothetical protein